MNAEQLAAFALLGMQKFLSPIPPPSDATTMEADTINKKRKETSRADAATSIPIASTKKHRKHADNGSSKKKQHARNMSRPLPLKKRNKFAPQAFPTKPSSPVEM